MDKSDIVLDTPVGKIDKIKVSSYTTLFKNFLTIIPAFTVILIIFGIIKLHLYYIGFGISILDFIDLSEILPMVSIDLMSVVLTLFVIIYFLFYLTSRNESSKPEDYETVMNEQKNEELYKYIISLWSIKQKNSFIFYISVIVRFTLMLCPVFCIIIGYAYPDHSLKLVSFQLLVISFPLSLLVFVPELIKYILNKPLTMLLIYFFVLAWFFYIQLIKNDYARTMVGAYRGTIVQTRDSTKSYISDREYFYIGKTKSYVFYYNKKDSSSTIIPVSEIREIKFKRN